MDNINYSEEMKEIIAKVMEEDQLENEYKLHQPIPEDDEPEWEADTEKCSGCITRVDSNNIKRGCEFCDEFWDVPELVK